MRQKGPEWAARLHSAPIRHTPATCRSRGRHAWVRPMNRDLLDFMAPPMAPMPQGLGAASINSPRTDTAPPSPPSSGEGRRGGARKEYDVTEGETVRRIDVTTEARDLGARRPDAGWARPAARRSTIPAPRWSGYVHKLKHNHGLSIETITEPTAARLRAFTRATSCAASSGPSRQRGRDMSECPAPLVPADVDLQNFGFMPLDLHRASPVKDLAALPAQSGNRLLHVSTCGPRAGTNCPPAAWRMTTTCWPMSAMCSVRSMGRRARRSAGRLGEML